MNSTPPSTEVVIIGAGLSGLVAARELLAAGKAVHIVDKGRGVGGRLATRRMGRARLDHGAQFFTVRGDEFRATVDAAIDAGVVDVWCRGFGETDGYPRYFCPNGMTGLAKWLTEQVTEAGATVSLGTRVSHIAKSEDNWELPLDSGERLRANDLIVTSPVPQTLDLLNDGSVAVDATIRAELEAMSYKPVISVLATLDGPSAIPTPGGVQQTEDEVFTFIADNQQKGISPEPAVTFHANGALSAERWDDHDDTVLGDLLAEAGPWLGTANVVEAQLKKWKYAGVYTPHRDRCVVAAKEPGALILAGDAFGGPKVEGAFNSGLAAARLLTALG